MSTSQHRLLLGTRGWDHADWVSAFYPDDLPADWRLAYYANEHRAVLWPATHCMSVFPGMCIPALSVVEMRQWAAELDAGFRFLFECVIDDSVVASATGTDNAALDTAIGAFVDAIAPLETHCAGIYLRLSAASRPWSLAVLETVLAGLGDIPVSVEPGDSVDLECGEGAALAQLLARHDAGLCWHGPPAAAHALARGRLALTLIDGPVRDLRLLRSFVEAGLAAGSAQRESVLIVAGKPADTNRAQ